MKNYVIKHGVRGMFYVDKNDVNNVGVIEPIASHIDWIYSATEDGTINLPNGTTKEVKKGDFVIVFYTAPYTNNSVIVIDSKEWKENIQSEEEYRIKQRENERDPQNINCESCDCAKPESK